jgi:hypothetical protein
MSLDPINGGGFDSVEDMLFQWEGARDALTKPGAEVVYYEYDQADYEGSALCIFRRDGEWYQATCSHCSCNGLDAFEPVRVTPKALLMQHRLGSLGTGPLRVLLEAQL